MSTARLVVDLRALGFRSSTHKTVGHFACPRRSHFAAACLLLEPRPGGTNDIGSGPAFRRDQSALGIPTVHQGFAKTENREKTGGVGRESTGEAVVRGRLRLLWSLSRAKSSLSTLLKDGFRSEWTSSLFKPMIIGAEVGGSPRQKATATKRRAALRACVLRPSVPRSECWTLLLRPSTPCYHIHCTASSLS